MCLRVCVRFVFLLLYCRVCYACCTIAICFSILSYVGLFAWLFVFIVCCWFTSGNLLFGCGLVALLAFVVVVV